jgi:hypothetical protein
MDRATLDNKGLAAQPGAASSIAWSHARFTWRGGLRCWNKFPPLPPRWWPERPDEPDEDNFFKPYNEFRHLNAAGTESTIAMAFACKDGVVVAADRQGTHPDGTLSEITKVFPISETGVVAFSGDSFQWIKEFMQHIKKHKDKTDEGQVRAAVESYQRYLLRQFGRDWPAQADFMGVLGTFNRKRKQSHVYQFGTMTLPQEEIETYRTTVGQGARTAKIFLRIAESAMQMVARKGGHTSWSRYSTKLVARLCLSILETLPTYERSVHGSQIFIVSELPPSEIDRPAVIGWKVFTPFAALMQSVWEEIPFDDLILADYQNHILPEKLVKPYFDDLEKKLPDLLKKGNVAFS